MSIIQILEDIGAFLKDDHFVYSSGKHGDIYINKNILFAHTRACDQAGRLMAEKFSRLDIDTVAGPIMCGILPAHWTAYHLSLLKGREVHGVFAERDASKNFQFDRGYDEFIAGKNVLAVDDITTSGATMKKFIDLVRATGGNVVNASVLVNRSPRSVSSDFLGAPFEPLGSIEIPTYEASSCPFCEKDVPINEKVGHGKQFVAARSAR